jgi:hypothetical protein
MRKRAKTKPPTSAKISPPAMMAEAGREYRDAAEIALTTATPGELRDLVIRVARPRT